MEHNPNSVFLDIDIVHKFNDKTTACNDVDMRIVSEGLFWTGWEAISAWITCKSSTLLKFVFILRTNMLDGVNIETHF